MAMFQAPSFAWRSPVGTSTPSPPGIVDFKKLPWRVYCAVRVETHQFLLFCELCLPFNDTSWLSFCITLLCDSYTIIYLSDPH